MSKLFEIVLQNKIKLILDSENIIPNHQFSFREKHGTVEQVDRVTGEITKCFEKILLCSFLRRCTSIRSSVAGRSDV